MQNKNHSRSIFWWLRVDFKPNNLFEISDMWLQCNVPTMRMQSEWIIYAKWLDIVALYVARHNRPTYTLTYFIVMKL